MNSSRKSKYQRSLERGSDEVFDFGCNSCDQVREAEYFCANCSELYCKRCFTNNHAGNKSHKVVKVSDLSEKCADKCPSCQREGTKASKHCVDHGQSCCLQCVEIYHSSCSNVSDTAKQARSFYTSTEFNSLKQEVEEKMNDVMKVISEKERKKNNLETEKQKSLERLDEFKKKVDATFDKLKQEAGDEYIAIMSVFDDSIETCEDILTSLRLHKIYIECGKATKPKRFMKPKEIKHELTEYDKSLVLEQQCPHHLKENELNVESHIQKFKDNIRSLKLNSITHNEDDTTEELQPTISTESAALHHTGHKGLGMMNQQHKETIGSSQGATSRQPDDAQPIIPEATTRQGARQMHVGINYTRPRLNRSVTSHSTNVSDDNEHCVPATPREREVERTSNARQYNIRIPEDEHRCNIQGMYGLSNETILLSDTKNKKLKLIDSNYAIIGYCDLPAGPRGVCEIDELQAVTALSNKTLQFVTLVDMKTSTFIALNHTCYGVSHYGGKLYVTQLKGVCVYVYDIYGKPLTIISEQDVSRLSRFVSTQQVYITRDGSRLYVTDSMKGLVILDSKGATKSTINYSELKSACGVCTDKSGNVYVSGMMSHNVLNLGRGGTKLRGTVVSAENGLSYPTSIWFNSSKSQLIVSNNPKPDGCNYLNIFNVKMP